MKDKLLIFKEDKLNFKTTLSILVLIMVTTAFWGFVYETIFYKIDLGYFVKRGSTFGPWIPIYAFGGLFITLATYRLRKNPFLVFAVNCVVTGVLEYLTGFVLYEAWGIRLWDYNTEIWNWGNINGYICLRSILYFGLSSLLLIYFVVPFIKKLALKLSEKKLVIISTCLGLTFALDILLYAIIK